MFINVTAGRSQYIGFRQVESFLIYKVSLAGKAVQRKQSNPAQAREPKGHRDCCQCKVSIGLQPFCSMFAVPTALMEVLPFHFSCAW